MPSGRSSTAIAESYRVGKLVHFKSPLPNSLSLFRPMSKSKRCYVDISDTSELGAAPIVRRVRVDMALTATELPDWRLVDYGPCQVCDVATGGTPYDPSYLFAEVNARFPEAARGMLEFMERGFTMVEVPSVDGDATQVFSMTMPARVPGMCMCSKECYIIRHTAAYPPDTTLCRALSSMGLYYLSTLMSPAQREFIDRARAKTSQLASMIYVGNPLLLCGPVGDDYKDDDVMDT